MIENAGSRIVARVLAGLLILSHVTATAAAEDEHQGVIEYEIACMPCHGLHGKGDGRQASGFNAQPSDLTRIAKSNGGKFPFDRVMAIIDGRELVAAHGQRAMPVWGNRYRVYVEPGETRTVVERRAKRRIRALTRYVQTLQVK